MSEEEKMSTAFKKEVRETERIIERSECYSADINGYSVIFEDDERNGAKLSIYPNDTREFPRVGIIEMRPKRVADIDALADNIPDLLYAIAAHLRNLGKDDLRAEYERTREQMHEMMLKIT